MCQSLKAPRHIVQALCHDVHAPCHVVQAPCHVVQAPCQSFPFRKMTFEDFLDSLHRVRPPYPNISAASLKQPIARAYYRLNRPTLTLTVGDRHGRSLRLIEQNGVGPVIFCNKEPVPFTDFVDLFQISNTGGEFNLCETVFLRSINFRLEGLTGGGKHFNGPMCLELDWVGKGEVRIESGFGKIM